MSGRSIYVVVPGGSQARGGMGRIVANLEREWAVRAHSVDLRVVDSYGPGSRLLMPFFFIRAIARVLAACLGGRVALLHVHMAANGSVVRKGAFVYLASALGAPVVLHLHGGDLEIFYRALGPRMRRAVARMIARADGVVVLGTYWYGFVVGELGIPPHRVDVVPNGMADPGDGEPRPDRRECRILFLGDVCDNKGLTELLVALADPRLRPLAWTARIAGKGEVDKYRSLARRLGIAERLLFLGWVPEAEAHDLLASSDVLVLPSRFEGLPMVVIEAMAHGLAVIATPVGAVPDAITHGETGLLVPVGDAAQLADALHRVLEDAALRRGLMRSARRRFVDRFQISAVTSQLEAIYAKYSRIGLANPLGGSVRTASDRS